MDVINTVVPFGFPIHIARGVWSLETNGGANEGTQPSFFTCSTLPLNAVAAVSIERRRDSTIEPGPS